MSREWGRGFRAGYWQGKEVGLSECGQAGEIAALRELLRRATDGTGTNTRTGATDVNGH